MNGEKREAAAPVVVQRMTKLFRILVLGGAVLAAAAGSFPRGDTGTPDSPGDGGVPGW